MHEWQSLSHVRWECKYHVVIIPKYRRKVFSGRLRHQIGPILRDLCRQRGVELLEGHAKLELLGHVQVILEAVVTQVADAGDGHPAAISCSERPMSSAG
jgi:putative transposase